MAVQIGNRGLKDSMKPLKICKPCTHQQSEATVVLIVPPKTMKPVATISHRERCSMSANY
jgi:hypothetical protein